MKLAVCVLLCAGALGLCLTVPEKTVRWCTVSDPEATKCSSFSDNVKKVFSADGPLVTCMKTTSYRECIRAIMANKADAVTIDGGLVFEAGWPPYNLKPIAAEFYGSKDDPQTHYYVVALVKKGTDFQLNQLQGKKSCHTGLGWSAGWIVPIGLLLPSGSLEAGAAKFFSGSCVPCADAKKFPSLCQLCAGKGTDKCACSSHEPYFGYSGAFKCLEDSVGDVSFVRHLTVFEVLPQKADRDQYELLCPDNTRRPVDEYAQCYLAKVPSHAVVARSVDGKEDLIWKLLSQAQARKGKEPFDASQVLIQWQAWGEGTSPGCLPSSHDDMVLDHQPLQDEDYPRHWGNQPSLLPHRYTEQSPTLERNGCLTLSHPTPSSDLGDSHWQFPLTHKVDS